MPPPEGRSLPRATRWQPADVAWGAVLVAALLLPAQATSTWFHATYTTTPADLVTGVWILKSSLATLAASALLLRRMADAAPAPRREDTSTGARSWMLVAVVMLVALGLRLYRLDTELWVDETYLRTRYVPLEFRQLLSTYDTQNHQPLYSLLAKVSFLLLGGSDWTLRIPSVLFGVASLWAVWRFGRRVASETQAVLAALVLAVSYHHVWFSQNARGYTAMLFLAVLGTHAFLDLAGGNARRRTVWLYALVLALATFAHLTAALIAVGHALALLLTTNWRSREARDAAWWPVSALALSALVTVVLYSLMIPQAWRRLTAPLQSYDVEWTGIGWMLREAARVLSQGVPGGMVAALVAVAVLGVGVLSYWRQSRLTTLAMLLPVLITLIAIVATGHNLWPRFFFFAGGFIVLLALRGGFVLVHSVIRWQPERVAVAGACAVAALSLLTVPRAWQPKQQFRAAYEFVESEREPGDQVVAVDIASWIYLLRGWAPTWRLTTRLSQVSDAERSARRTWVVYTLPARLRALDPELFEGLVARYEEIRVFPATVGGGEIHVLRHDSPPQ